MKDYNPKRSYAQLGFQSMTCTTLVVALFSSGCMLISYPDSCKQSRCSLKPDASEPKKPSMPLALGDTRLVEICACRPLNASHIQVEAGRLYIFHIAELFEPWVDGPVCASPGRGWEDKTENFIGTIFSFLKRSDKANWYALMGVIAETDKSTEDKDSFPIFNEANYDSASLFMTQTGQLFFYANDKNGRYFNNKGGLLLQVTRIK